MASINVTATPLSTGGVKLASTVSDNDGTVYNIKYYRKLSSSEDSTYTLVTLDSNSVDKSPKDTSKPNPMKIVPYDYLNKKGSNMANINYDFKIVAEPSMMEKDGTSFTYYAEGTNDNGDTITSEIVFVNIKATYKGAVILVDDKPTSSTTPPVGEINYPLSSFGKEKTIPNMSVNNNYYVHITLYDSSNNYITSNHNVDLRQPEVVKDMIVNGNITITDKNPKITLLEDKIEISNSSVVTPGGLPVSYIYTMIDALGNTYESFSDSPLGSFNVRPMSTDATKFSNGDITVSIAAMAPFGIRASSDFTRTFTISYDDKTGIIQVTLDGGFSNTLIPVGEVSDAGDFTFKHSVSGNSQPIKDIKIQYTKKFTDATEWTGWFDTKNKVHDASSTTIAYKDLIPTGNSVYKFRFQAINDLGGTTPWYEYPTVFSDITHLFMNNEEFLCTAVKIPVETLKSINNFNGKDVSVNDLKFSILAGSENLTLDRPKSLTFNGTTFKLNASPKTSTMILVDKLNDGESYLDSTIYDRINNSFKASLRVIQDSYENGLVKDFDYGIISTVNENNEEIKTDTRGFGDLYLVNSYVEKPNINSFKDIEGSKMISYNSTWSWHVSLQGNDKKYWNELTYKKWNLLKTESFQAPVISYKDPHVPNLPYTNTTGSGDIIYRHWIYSTDSLGSNASFDMENLVLNNNLDGYSGDNISMVENNITGWFGSSPNGSIGVDEGDDTDPTARIIRRTSGISGKFHPSLITFKKGDSIRINFDIKGIGIASGLANNLLNVSFYPKGTSLTKELNPSSTNSIFKVNGIITNGSVNVDSIKENEWTRIEILINSSKVPDTMIYFTPIFYFGGANQSFSYRNISVLKDNLVYSYIGTYSDASPLKSYMLDSYKFSRFSDGGAYKGTPLVNNYGSEVNYTHNIYAESDKDNLPIEHRYSLYKNNLVKNPYLEGIPFANENLVPNPDMSDQTIWTTNTNSGTEREFLNEDGENFVRLKNITRYNYIRSLQATIVEGRTYEFSIDFRIADGVETTADFYIFYLSIGFTTGIENQTLLQLKKSQMLSEMGLNEFIEGVWYTYKCTRLIDNHAALTLNYALGNSTVPIGTVLDFKNLSIREVTPESTDRNSLGWKLDEPSKASLVPNIDNKPAIVLNKDSYAEIDPIKVTGGDEYYINFDMNSYSIRDPKEVFELIETDNIDENSPIKETGWGIDTSTKSISETPIEYNLLDGVYDASTVISTQGAEGNSSLTKTIDIPELGIKGWEIGTKVATKVQGNFGLRFRVLQQSNPEIPGEDRDKVRQTFWIRNIGPNPILTQNQLGRHEDGVSDTYPGAAIEYAHWIPNDKNWYKLSELISLSSPEKVSDVYSYMYSRTSNIGTVDKVQLAGITINYPNDDSRGYNIVSNSTFSNLDNWTFYPTNKPGQLLENTKQPNPESNYTYNFLRIPANAEGDSTQQVKYYSDPVYKVSGLSEEYISYRITFRIDKLPTKRYLIGGIYCYDKDMKYVGGDNINIFEFGLKSTDLNHWISLPLKTMRTPKGTAQLKLVLGNPDNETTINLDFMEVYMERTEETPFLPSKTELMSNKFQQGSLGKYEWNIDKNNSYWTIKSNGPDILRFTEKFSGAKYDKLRIQYDRTTLPTNVTHLSLVLKSSIKGIIGAGTFSYDKNSDITDIDLTTISNWNEIIKDPEISMLSISLFNGATTSSYFTLKSISVSSYLNDKELMLDSNLLSTSRLEVSRPSDLSKDLYNSVSIKYKVPKGIEYIKPKFLNKNDINLTYSNFSIVPTDVAVSRNQDKFKNPNLLDDTSWNNGQGDWNIGFNNRFEILDPEKDKPNLNILHSLPLTLTTQQLSHFPHPLKVNKGTTFTLSMDYKYINGDLPRNNALFGIVRIFPEANTPNAGVNTVQEVKLLHEDFNFTAASMDEFTRITKTFTIESDGWLDFLPYNNNKSGKMEDWWRGIKLELGSEATEWGETLNEVPFTYEPKLIGTTSTTKPYSGLDLSTYTFEGYDRIDNFERPLQVYSELSKWNKYSYNGAKFKINSSYSLVNNEESTLTDNSYTSYDGNLYIPGQYLYTSNITYTNDKLGISYTSPTSSTSFNINTVTSLILPTFAVSNDGIKGTARLRINLNIYDSSYTYKVTNLDTEEEYILGNNMTVVDEGLPSNYYYIDFKEVGTYNINVETTKGTQGINQSTIVSVYKNPPITGTVIDSKVYHDSMSTDVNPKFNDVILSSTKTDHSDNFIVYKSTLLNPDNTVKEVLSPLAVIKGYKVPIMEYSTMEANIYNIPNNSKRNKVYNLSDKDITSSTDKVVSGTENLDLKLLDQLTFPDTPKVSISSSNPTLTPFSADGSTDIHVRDNVTVKVTNSSDNWNMKCYLDGKLVPTNTVIDTMGFHTYTIIFEDKHNYTLSYKTLNIYVNKDYMYTPPFIDYNPKGRPTKPLTISIDYILFNEEESLIKSKEYSLSTSPGFKAYTSPFNISEPMTITARKTMKDGMTVSSDLVITLDMLEIPKVTVPVISDLDIDVNGKPTSIYIPSIKSELGYTYKMKLNGYDYSEGTPITNYNRNVRNFKLEVTGTVTTTGQSAKLTKDFVIDTMPPNKPSIKGLVSSTINKLPKDFKAIIDSKEIDVTYQIFRDNVEVKENNLLLDQDWYTDRSMNVTVVAVKNSNKMINYSTYYIDNLDDNLFDEYDTQESDRNVLIPLNQDSGYFTEPRELVINNRTGDLSIVSTDYDSELGAYKLDRITGDIRDLLKDAEQEIGDLFKWYEFSNERYNFLNYKITAITDNNAVLDKLITDIEAAVNAFTELELSVNNTHDSIIELINNGTIVINKVNEDFVAQLQYLKDNENTISNIKTKFKTNISEYNSIMSNYAIDYYNLKSVEIQANTKIKKTDYDAWSKKKTNGLNQLKSIINSF